MNTAPQQSNETAPQYAQVAVPVHLRKLFTYRLPPAMRAAARVGSRVMVQLGPKPTAAYIVDLLPRLRAGTSLVESEIKDIQELLDVDPPLTAEVLELSRWVADYYSAPWGEVLRAALPAGINATVEQAISITQKGRELFQSQTSAAADGSKKLRALSLLADVGEFEVGAFALRLGAARMPGWLRELENEGFVVRSYRTSSLQTRAKRRKAVRLLRPLSIEDERVSKAQLRLVETLSANESTMPVGDLTKVAAVSESVVRTLVKRGVLEEFDEEVRRDPLGTAELPAAEDLELTSAQDEARLKIETQIHAGNFKPMLLHGVTGSGKTEVYIRAMRAALAVDRGAMMLVPEIALTPILSRRLRAHFGGEIAIFHSSLSKGERFDEWARLRSGEARVVLGTRSAVFAPVKKLGVIIVDEEQDASYRQEESPFYHARDSAIVRAQKESAVVVLGSATPSLESFHNALAGKYEYLQLPERIANRPSREPR